MTKVAAAYGAIAIVWSVVVTIHTWRWNQVVYNRRKDSRHPDTAEVYVGVIHGAVWPLSIVVAGLTQVVLRVADIKRQRAVADASVHTTSQVTESHS